MTSMKAVRWHGAFDIRVEDVPKPTIQDPDDAIVKVSLAALCGMFASMSLDPANSAQDPTSTSIADTTQSTKRNHICGHEFIGEVVELGASFGAANAQGRPELYSSLKVGDKVVSPFTVNCGECTVCRLGYTCRCPAGALFGSPVLPGGQAQFVRVPKAGGTLFNLSDARSWNAAGIHDSSLLLLADILPTGLFAALQAMNHPKVLPAVTGRAYPASFSQSGRTSAMMTEADRVLSFAIIGLGPVGLCAAVSLLDMLATQALPFQIVAVDPVAERRDKAMAIYKKIGAGGTFVALGIDEAKEEMKTLTGGVGANAVLEVVGNPSALTLGYALVRPFGAIVSVGVHGAAQMPFTGRELYGKNVSFDFGRCPARAMFPMAFDLLGEFTCTFKSALNKAAVKRQDVFGSVGSPDSLVDRIVSPDDAVEMYKLFEQNKVGKVVFDMSE
ncbi:hypothetical protein MKEN_00347700 [Mycena kentingensis (nom. inval.)]|nr:hypothetical protein MKEN_00347700 [Mycena kentingensis (nom. inval.)]